MTSRLKRKTAVLLAILWVALAFPSQLPAQSRELQEENSAVAMFGDALIIRPLGLAATVLGAAVFVISLPFHALGGNTREAARKLVVEPAEYTFKRPLGEI